MIVIWSLFVQFLDCLVIQSTLPGLPLVTKIVASSGGIGGISLGAPEHLRRAPSINFPSTPAQGETALCEYRAVIRPNLCHPQSPPSRPSLYCLCLWKLHTHCYQTKPLSSTLSSSAMSYCTHCFGEHSVVVVISVFLILSLSLYLYLENCTHTVIRHDHPQPRREQRCGRDQRGKLNHPRTCWGCLGADSPKGLLFF